MLVWLFMIFSIVVLSLILNSKSEKNKKTYLGIVAIILIFVVGSRNAEINYGSDINNYFRLFQNAILMDWTQFESISTMEKGYLAISFILAKLIPWGQTIIYAQASFCIITVLYFIYKNTENVQLATIFFICFGPFQFFLTGFRQAIAICIGLLMFEVAKKKKYVKYIILLLIAISIHQTAIVLIPLYFLVNIKNTSFSNIAVIVGSVILTAFSRNFVNLGNEFFDRDYRGVFFGSALGGLIQLFIYATTLLLCLFFSKAKSDDEHKKNSALIRVLIVGTAVYAMRFEALVLERVSFYFTPAVMPLLSEKVQKMSSSQLFKGIAVVCSVGLFAWRTISQYGGYTFFWQ